MKSDLSFYSPTLLSNVDFFSSLAKPSWAETSLKLCSSIQNDAQIYLRVAIVNAESNSLIDRFSNYKHLIAVIGRVIWFVRKWMMIRSQEVKYSISLTDSFISACIAVICLL